MNSYRCIKFQVNFRQKLKDFYKQAEHLIWKLKNHPYLPSTNTNVNDKKKLYREVFEKIKESWRCNTLHEGIKMGNILYIYVNQTSLRQAIFPIVNISYSKLSITWFPVLKVQITTIKIIHHVVIYMDALGKRYYS